jgi:hypothetical protein
MHVPSWLQAVRLLAREDVIMLLGDVSDLDTHRVVSF